LSTVDSDAAAPALMFRVQSDVVGQKEDDVWPRISADHDSGTRQNCDRKTQSSHFTFPNVVWGNRLNS
jgi:hypothetical protein